MLFAENFDGTLWVNGADTCMYTETIMGEFIKRPPGPSLNISKQ